MNQKLKEEEGLNLKEILRPYFRHWPWFILSAFIFILGAMLYLRYSSYVYKSKATILIKDEGKGGLSELAAFGDLGLGGAGLSKSDFENEIEIIKSKRLVSRVVKDHNLNVRYFKEGNVKSSEIFNDGPFSLKLISFSGDSISKFFHSVSIEPLSATTFNLVSLESNVNKTFNYGEIIILDFGSIVVTAEQGNEFVKGSQVIVTISDFDTAVNNLKQNLRIQPVNKNSSVIELEYNSSAPKKSETILDGLVDAYNNDAIEDKNLISANTARFIDNRLEIITRELDSVETKNVNFRENEKVTDIATEGQIFLESANELQRKQLELNTKIGLAQSIQDYLNSGKTSELLPSNLGISDEGISNSIEKYNELILEKQRLLKSATVNNPVVIAVNDQISQLEENIKQSLGRATRSLEIEANDLIKQRGNLGGKIAAIPSLTKAARDIMRQQEIKEALYLYLLQKREETAISLAVTTPKAKIVDRAYTAIEPISPKPNIIYLASLILGLLVPFVFIYVKKLFDTKIHNRVDVEKELPLVPILGEVPTIDSKESETITSNDRSVLAEAFRILRTNLSYFINSKHKEGKNLIYVTSTIKGEGKTFVSYNLALTLASTGKSVLLVGADIRNPQLHRYIDKNEWTIGLSEYLYDTEVSIDSITNEVMNDKERFDLILSGKIAPNPAELLMNGRFENLVDQVKNKYDYVIIDTAPTLLVTDTLLISQQADMTVYVCRADHTDKNLLQYPKELIDEGKLKNVAFAINGVKMNNFGYGSKYGYGYGQDAPTFIQRIKNKLGIGN
ncbi:GumC family protein [Dokdonia sp. Hel_I_53]|uniref:GumC family protein n=1 Tax=Dokdonia sp. Hel_I_53 TaxID=1566287 RepID=UPI001199EE86|nr:tyrosine-protein kinase [Dokdonia sp. Hel_I_53]TVZ51356.1 capsular exopolysaccharide synthesis family protein [Dokdonia sp. Hel_I_53]